MPKAAAQFGSFALLEKLATGGMAEIFLARQRSLGGFERLVVIKRILPESSEDPQLVRGFLEEAKLAAHLNHPNIAHIHDVGRIGPTYFLAMEYVRGFDLGELLADAREREQPLPLDVAMTIICDVCAALHHAHEAGDADGVSLGIVHRDVSPSNVLVSHEGVTKLVDFGIAKATSKQAQQNTRTGTLKGKLGYFAPEQVLGQPIDRRVDIFAAGIVFFELLTNHHPFRSDTELQTLQSLAYAALPDARALRPEITPAVEELLRRATAKAPDARWKSGVEMAEAIRAAAAAMGVALAPGAVKSCLAERSATLEAARLRKPARLETSESGIEDRWSVVSADAEVTQVEAQAQRRSRRGSSFLWLAACALAAFFAWPKGPRPAPEAAAMPTSAPVTQEALPPPSPPAEPKRARRVVPAPKLAVPAAADTRPGKLRFAVEPWGQIFLDERDLGVTPLPATDVSAGEHVVRIVHAGHSFTRRVTVTPGQLVTIQHAF